MKKILLIGIMGTWMMFKYGSQITHLFKPSSEKMTKDLVMASPATTAEKQSTYYFENNRAGASINIPEKCVYQVCVKKANDKDLETEKKEEKNESFLWNLILL